jgi:hypothetical protein
MATTATPPAMPAPPAAIAPPPKEARALLLAAAPAKPLALAAAKAVPHTELALAIPAAVPAAADAAYTFFFMALSFVSRLAPCRLSRHFSHHLKRVKTDDIFFGFLLFIDCFSML